MQKIIRTMRIGACAVGPLALLQLPGVALGQVPAAAEKTSSTAETVVAAPEQKFDVMEYRVLGNSTLPAIEVERAWYWHSGPVARSAMSSRLARVSKAHIARPVTQRFSSTYPSNV